MKAEYLYVVLLIIIGSCGDGTPKGQSGELKGAEAYYSEPYRPQFHFSPEEKWMNDPNGLVYHEETYHLFYQYYPEDIVWGPMHWGHATSKDLVFWEHRPIALYPDDHGYIFSGSAVVDQKNTSGLGTEENPPLVAIFTYHSKSIQDSGRDDYETQGIAFSLDNGSTWTKYEGNPVIQNPGAKDFRDPKVFWNEEAKTWSMLLVAGDHLQIWSSPDLLAWEKVSEFGKGQGAHGGVWECPDMFKLKVEGTNEEKWVLLISINPGAPNGGSGTQYFIGDFDGKTFRSDQKEAKWVDPGTDNYAGVTYNNAPNGGRIFIGWMSNWAYATKTPTKKWRSAMTVPRKLSLRNIQGKHHLISYPIEGFDVLSNKGQKRNLQLDEGTSEVVSFNDFNQSEIRFFTQAKDFRLAFKNKLDETLVLEMNASDSTFSVDRAQSGKIDFQSDFAKVQSMPVPQLPDGEYEVRLLMDRSSMEVFINGGQYVMTVQLFPNDPYTLLEVGNTSLKPIGFNGFQVNNIERIW